MGDPEGLRADRLRLHAIAHTLVNGAPLTINADDQSIWQLAGGIAPVRAITDGEIATIRDPCVGTVELKDAESLRRP